MKKQGFNLRLLQQHFDFEDEIMHCNGININQFYTTFNVRNKTEFKSNMISEKMMYEKICRLIRDFTIWNSLLISHLDKFEKSKCNFTKLPKKPLKKIN